MIKNYKLQDVLFYRGLEGYSGPFLTVGGQDGFYEGHIYFNTVNIFYLAVHHRFLDVVDYILKDLKVVGSNRITKNVDPRIVISVEGDPTAVIRTLLYNWDNAHFFKIWNDYGYLFDEHDMLLMTKCFIWMNRMSTIEDFIRSDTTQRIFINAHQSIRQSFIDIIRDKNDATISQLTYSYPYTSLDRLPFDEEYLPQLDRLIRDNEIDHLRNLIEQQRI